MAFWRKAKNAIEGELLLALGRKAGVEQTVTLEVAAPTLSHSKKIGFRGVAPEGASSRVASLGLRSEGG